MEFKIYTSVTSGLVCPGSKNSVSHFDHNLPLRNSFTEKDVNIEYGNIEFFHGNIDF